MKFTLMCQPLIERIEKSLTRLLDEAVASEKSKIYINVVSEVKAFVKSFKVFLGTLRTLEELYPDLKSGRMCFKWIYAENDNAVSLVRLESGLSMIYTGEYIKITYNDKVLTLYEIPRLSVVINQYSDTINLDNEDEVVAKRSSLLDVLNSIKTQVEKATENLSICIKYVKLRIS
ncbi:MAG: hypothetical protein QW775_03420 [Ignisphaera sp.]|uniref:Uncharacterized protein n=1 Tax=Ignisphaera aggregans TaxID=334771 RepID=A0A7C4JJN6_9CREN